MNLATGAADTYQQISGLRNEDHYPPEINIENLIDSFFPNSIESLVLELSNITASFYGLLLQQALYLQGDRFAETLSQATFYQLGKLKAQQALSKSQNIHKDSRGIALVIISAIFTSSPEFKIKVMKFEASEVRLYITGVDRYHRIAKMLNIEEKMSWPTVKPFLLGIRDCLGIDCNISAKIIRLEDNSQCEYEISLSKSNGVRNINSHNMNTLTMRPPFISIPDDSTFYGNIMSVRSVEVSDYSLINMPSLLQQYLGIEAINFNRQRSTDSVWYMLGKSLRIYRCDNLKNNTPHKTIVESIVSNSSHRRSAFTFLSSENNPIYKGLYEYRALDGRLFKKLFSSYKVSDTMGDSIVAMPDIINTSFQNPYNYSSIIYPFSEDHCCGHFPNYPLVPGIFIYERIVNNQLDWIGRVGRIDKDRVFLESSQQDVMFPFLPNVTHIVQTQVWKISHSYYKFLHEIYNGSEAKKLVSLIADYVSIRN